MIAGRPADRPPLWARRLVVAAAVLVGLACSASTAQAQRDAPALGVELDLLAMGPADRATALEAAARMGATWLRLPVSWAALEPVQGRPGLDSLNSALAEAAGAGLRVVVQVHSAPPWARRDEPPPTTWWLCDRVDVGGLAPDASGPPTDPADLARFLTAVLDGTPGRIDALELWREPNLLPNWRAGGPDPHQYAALLRAVIPRLRSVAPEVALLSAAPAPVRYEASPVCFQSDLAFMRVLADDGVLDEVDGIGLAAPGLEDGALEAPDPDRLNFRRLELHRAQLERAGLGAKSVWLMAWGWEVGGAKDGPGPAHWTPEAAVAELGAAWGLAVGGWPWVKVMVLSTAAPEGPHRLWSRDGQLTPMGSAAARWAAPGPAAVPTGPSPLAPDRRWPLSALAALTMASAWLLAPRLAAGRAQEPAAAPADGPLPGVGPLAVAASVVLVQANASLRGPVGLVPLAALAAMAVRWPALPLWLAAGLLPWRDTLRPQLLGRPVLPTEMFILVAAFALVVRGGRPPSGWRRPAMRALGAADPRTLRWAGALIGWAMLAAAWAEWPRPAWFEWRTVIVDPILVYLLLRAQPRRWPAARGALVALVAGAAAAAAWGLAGVAAGALTELGLAPPHGLATGVAAEGVVRARGPYASPNNLALWLGRCLPLAVAWTLATMGGRSRWRWLAPAVILAGLAMTFSRGSLVFGLPALAIVAYLAARRGDVPRRPARRVMVRGRHLAMTAAVVVALAVAALPVLRSERFRETLSFEPGSTGSIRLALWSSTMRMISDHPLLGVGPDNFLYAYRDVYVRREVIQERALSHPHNLLLDWASRLGLPGLVIGLAILALPVTMVVRVLRRPGGSPGRRVWAWGLLGYLAYGLSHGVVDNHFFLIDLAAGLWIVIAAAQALDEAGVEVQGDLGDGEA